MAECGIYKEKARCLSEPLAVWTGLEPATPCVTGRYSNQLNYHTVFLSVIIIRTGDTPTLRDILPTELPHCLQIVSDSECKGKHNFQISKQFAEIFPIFFTLIQYPSPCRC